MASMSTPVTSSQNSDRRRRRPPPGPTIWNSTLQIPVAASRDAVWQVAVEALVPYLIYSRGLWPVPVVEDGATKAAQALEQLVVDWTKVVASALEVHVVEFRFGPTWARPREVYRLCVHGDGDAAFKAQTLHSRLIRSVVPHEAPLGRLAPSDKLLMGLAVTPTSLQRAHALESLDAPDFAQPIPRILDKLRRVEAVTSKATKVVGNIEIRGLNGGGAEPKEELLWLCLQTSVPGFRLPRTR